MLGLKICAATAGIRNYKSIINEKRKKTIISVKRRRDHIEIKEEIKNPESSVKYTLYILFI